LVNWKAYYNEGERGYVFDVVSWGG
jgi:hypothetical protein